MFTGSFLPTTSAASLCLLLSFPLCSFLAQPHILPSHLVPGQQDRLKPTKPGKKTKPIHNHPLVPQYSLKSLKIKNPKILSNCPGKQFFRKGEQNRDCLNHVRRVKQIIPPNIFHMSYTNQPLLQS